MRAEAAWTEAAAEDAAVIAALLAEETRLAFGALIDDDRLGQVGGQGKEVFVRLTLTEPEATLAARVGAPDLATPDGKRASARAAATLLR